MGRPCRRAGAIRAMYAGLQAIRDAGVPLGAEAYDSNSRMGGYGRSVANDRRVESYIR